MKLYTSLHCDEIKLISVSTKFVEEKYNLVFVVRANQKKYALVM